MGEGNHGLKKALGKIILLLLFDFFNWGSLSSQGFLPEGQAIHSWLQGKYSKNAFHGVYSLYAGDSLVAQGAMGFSDKEQQHPLTVNTPFMVASVSKTFTATAVLKLYEKGKIDLDTFL